MLSLSIHDIQDNPGFLFLPYLKCWLEGVKTETLEPWESFLHSEPTFTWRSSGSPVHQSTKRKGLVQKKARSLNQGKGPKQISSDKGDLCSAPIEKIDINHLPFKYLHTHFIATTQAFYMEPSRFLKWFQMQDDLPKGQSAREGQSCSVRLGSRPPSLPTCLHAVDDHWDYSSKEKLSSSVKVQSSTKWNSPKSLSRALSATPKAQKDKDIPPTGMEMRFPQRTYAR